MTRIKKWLATASTILFTVSLVVDASVAQETAAIPSDKTELTVSATANVKAVDTPNHSAQKKAGPKIKTGKTKSNAAAQALFWYAVVNGQTQGAHVRQGTKQQVIDEQDCKDETDEICLYGSTENDLPSGTDVSDADPSQLIMRSF